MFSHIAWLTDGSAQAGACEALVVTLARLDDAEVRVVRAVPEGEAPDRAHAQVTHAAQRLVDQGLNARGSVVEGQPEAFALSFSHPDGLLAVGRTGVRNPLHLGSTTRRILREAHAPVLVGVPGFRSLDRILVGVDPSHSASPLGPALDLARHTGALLTVVHVASVDQTMDPDELIEGLREMTRRTLGGLPAPRLRFEVGLAETAGDGLVQVARDHDLLVTGSHGRRGLARLFLGSVAERVTERSPIPVLVTRSK